MTATGLKPPPRFVKDPRAWAYTLNKCAEKGQVDEYGNPLNYGMAIAIYKRVVAKYSGTVLDRPEAVEYEQLVFRTRADLLSYTAPAWFVSHNSAWSANDEAHQRLYLSSTWREARTGNSVVVEPLIHFVIERHYEDGRVETAGIRPEIALWLVEQNRAAHDFVFAAGCDAVIDLRSGRAEIALLDATGGEIRGLTVLRQFFDARESTRRINDVLSQFGGAGWDI